MFNGETGMRRLIAPLLLASLVGAAPAPDENAKLVALYRDLHAHPELGFQEVATSARLVKEIAGLGYEVTTGVGKTGIVAVMKNGLGPVLLIRTDMDALPVAEETGLAYASRATGLGADGKPVPTMHACGHDIHMSSWVGLARRLAATRDKWSGTVMLIGQPAEEGVGGAKAMLADNLYTRFPKPNFALALHDSASLPAGQVGITDGYALANVDSVDILVRGIGSHGSEPQNGIDPIVIGARIVGTLQTLVSRENDPRQPAVVTVGSFHAGTKRNIISNEAKLELTIRSYDPVVRQRLVASIRRVAKAEAEAAGVPDDLLPVVTQEEGSESTFNTPAGTKRITTALDAALGRDRVIRVLPSMAAEDFGAFARGYAGVESVMFWVGAQPQAKWDAANGDPRKLPGLHSSKFAPDPGPTIATAVDAMQAAAMSVIGKGANPS